MIYGKYKLLDKENPSVYAYTREEGDQKLLIVLNFSDSSATTEVSIPDDAKVILSNYSDGPTSADQESIMLRPYEAVIYKL